jgi:NAD(P)-dependent dehydrogenase (short-subunit alcohol dehydrogenase family)
MSGLLDGRHALVTGAANGIGRAIADAFRAEGATVSGVDREEGTEFRLDLERAEGIAALVDEVERAAGPLDVLCSVAGIFEPAAALDMPLDSYRRVLAVNLDAPVLLAQRCARGMSTRGYGRILAISSIHGRFSEPTALSYDISKAGLEGATRTLAIELAPHGVLVNALAPGFVHTRMSVVDGADELDSEWFRSIYIDGRKLPLGRAAKPAEIAAHAVWLCSERNTYLTGQTITVDGGLTSTF